MHLPPRMNQSHLQDNDGVDGDEYGGQDGI